MLEILTKTKTGYERDDGSARYRYDSAGKYLGQYQPDMLSEDCGGGDLYFETYPGDRCYHELTAEQMHRAGAN